MTSTLPPDVLHHRCATLNKVPPMRLVWNLLPVPSTQLSGYCLLNEMKEDEAPHLQMRSRQCLHAYYTGIRSSRNKISSQVCSVNRQKQGHNEHNQLTNPKQVLFRLNGQRCRLNPTGFGLLSFGNTLLQLLTWAALEQCEQECKVFQFSQHGSREKGNLYFLKSLAACEAHIMQLTVW